MTLLYSAYDPLLYMTVPQFAKRAGISKILVYKWIERGHIMHYRFGTGPRATIVIPKTQLKIASARKRRAAR